MNSPFSIGGEAPTFPGYIQNFHHDLMTGDRVDSEGVSHPYPYNVKQYLSQALAAGSPYSIRTPYDAGPDLDTIAATNAQWAAFMETIEPGDYSDLMSQAAVEVALALDSEDQVDAAVAAFDQKQRAQLRAQLNSYCGAMSDVRATQNSQFKMGLALLYADHNRGVGEFRANLELQDRKTEAAMIMNATSEMMRIRLSQVDWKQRAAMMTADLALKRAVAGKENIADQVAFAEADALYYLELFKYGENMLHALSGVATVPARLPKGASALAGMASGAGTAVAVGTALGGVLGPQGALIGGAAMLALSGLASYAQGY